MLRYKIFYSWGMIRSDVGEARLDLSKGQNSHYGEYFHSIAVGHSYKFYDLFFKIRDLFEVKFSTTTGRPLYFHRDISEGRYTMKNWYQYHKDNTIWARVKRKEEPMVDTLLQATDSTFDVLSLFYHVRTLDPSKMAIGERRPISFAIDKELYNLYYRFEGREKIKVAGLGSFNALKFAATVVTGEVFTGENELIVWVSDDKNKIPLLFETPIKVGRVVGRLVQFENLKWPLIGDID